MGNITLTAAPTFPQPNYSYERQNDGNARGNPPPFSEYDQQLHYLASNQMPGNDSGYWENTRNEAVKLLNEQVDPYVSFLVPVHIVAYI